MKRTITLAFSAIILSLNIFAQVPQTMNFQGILKDADGLPVNDTKFMEFRIYSVETGGTVLWTEQHLNVGITDGLFSVTLGENTPFPNTNFFIVYPEVFITFVVGGEEMLPRQKFNSVPYSIRTKNADFAQESDESYYSYYAENAGQLNGLNSNFYVQQDGSGNATIDGIMTADAYEGDGSSLTNLPPTPDTDWTEGTDKVYNLTDNIGIGTASPDAPLHVMGRIYQDGLYYGTYFGLEVGGTITSATMYNTAFGRRALYANNNGDYNLALGSYAAYNNTSGGGNIAIGYNSLYTNTVGSQNIAIGRCSSYNGADYTSSIAIGDSAFYDHGDYSTEGGIAIGQNAARQGAGSRATVIGFETVIQNTTGYNLTAVGWKALRNNTSGRYNTAVGTVAMEDNTSGQRNTSTGYASLAYNVDGDYNSAYGTYSLNSNISGSSNSAFGDYALQDATGNRNSAFGSSSSAYVTTGSYNSSLGVSSLSGNTEGDYNTAIGYRAYYSNYPYNTTYDNSTAVGHYAPITNSNQVRIGNSSVTSIGGYTSWSNLSDGRFKQNVKENVPGLDFILKLKPVTYNLDVDKLNNFLHIPDSVQNISKLKNYANEKSNIQYTGFIAQEVEETANELGFDFSGIDKPQNEESHYSLRYAEFVVPLVKAVQELNDNNTALEDQLLEQKLLIEQQNQLIIQLSDRIEKIEDSK
jgi:hypothetical protein